MGSSLSKYPIHPFYQELNEKTKKFEWAFTFMQILPPRLRQRVFVKIRAREAERVEFDNMPKTVRKELEVSGGPDNVKVSAIVFRPPGSENEELPVIIYCHGGGWAIGSIKSHAKFISDLCIKTHAAVMGIEYSLSPEVKFPVANEQTYAALCWLSEYGRSIKVNPDKIAIAGDSAGGNMATVVSMMARDRNMGHALKAQALLYPVVTDQDPTKYESYQTYGQGDCGLSIKMTQVSSAAYLDKPPSEYNDRYVTPIIAANEQLQGLPFCILLTSECDILRDEGEEYAQKLKDADVYTISIRVLGAIHAFINAPVPETPQYCTALNAIAEFLKDQLLKIDNNNQFGCPSNFNLL